MKIASRQKQAGLKIDPTSIRKRPMLSPSEPPSQPSQQQLRFVVDKSPQSR